MYNRAGLLLWKLLMDLLDKIQMISRWRRGDQRAPHKP